MSNVLTYTLSLQDKVSGVLKTIGIHNHALLNAFAKLETNSKKVAEGLQMMGRSVSTLQQKIELLKAERDLLPENALLTIRKYNSEINKLQGRVQKLQTLNGNPVKKMVGDALNSLPGFVTNPAVIVGVGIGSAIKKGMEADMQKANMLTLYRGNEEAAQESYKKIADYGAKSPYEKAGLIEVQKTMMGFGIEGGKAFEVMQQLGDIAMGNAEKMQSLALAFSQATSAGKLQGQDLLQMINAGFNPLQVISERTGESMASLKKRMEKGAIGAQELASAFKMATDENGLFYKGAEKAGKTLGGKWSTLMDSFNELLLSVYNTIYPLLMPLIETATTLLNSIASGISWVVTKFKEGDPVIRGIALALGIFTAALLVYNTYTAISTALQNGFTAAIIKTNLAFLANPVFWLIAGIIALIAVIVLIYHYYDGWGKAWGHLMTYLKSSWEAFKSYFLIAWLSIQDAFMKGVELIKKGWYNLKSLWNKSAANEGLAAIEKDRNERAAEMAKAAGNLRKELLEAETAKNSIFGDNGLHRNGNTLQATVNNLKNNLGLGGTMPGAPPVQPLAEGGNGHKAINQKGAKANEAIATGGTKNTTIHISIGKQIETLTVVSNNIKEGAGKIRDIIVDEMTRALAMSQSLADN
jgi:tape measure domain-containing protein